MCLCVCACVCLYEGASCFFFNDTATTEIYTLSLHDALPISGERVGMVKVKRVRTIDCVVVGWRPGKEPGTAGSLIDRKSTRLNSSHANISYAVFCLKKKKYNRSRLVRRN